ncbi:RodZ family helix-turn-helix domain-containing protein [Halobacteriovorax sp. HLS]|uniref:helix-turn-helix domain-containing protein n=1 Tax=Halobacteriovorax sp. HLS TaxID=2234000 RepID=UPI0013E29CCB|nr:helix-turn-helix domain-containing protein [Halobacteriovorax sp. HLS]
MSTEHREDIKDQEVIQNASETEHEELVETPVELSEALTIGEVLKAAREERKLSLKVISQHTKISTTILEHLEANRFNDLPSKAYVIGFVKNYSKTVNLNTNDCLQLLNEAYGVTPEVTAVESHSPTPTREHEPTEESSSNEIPSQYLTIAGVFLALIIVVTIAINSSSETNKEQILTQQAQEVDEVAQTPLVNVMPQEVSEETPLTETKKPQVEAQAVEVKAETAPEVKPAPVKVEKAQGPKKEEIKVAEKVEPKIQEEEKKEEKEKKVELRPLSLPLYSVSADKTELQHLPDNIKSSLIAGKQNVFINAVDGDTWITYKSDDNAIKKFVLKQGRTLLIRGDLIRIFLGNINVARVFLNNDPLTITTRSGVKSLVFPQESAKDFKLPLFIYKKNGKAITSSEYEQDI